MSNSFKKLNNQLANLLHIMYVCLNVCKQMIDSKLLLLHNNNSNHLTVCKK